MSVPWVNVRGVVVEGHRVASQPSKDYPYSSLERQKPFFKARGLDLDACFLGTLNISIAPRTWEMIKPQFTFRQIAWTDLHPPEDFSFSACRVIKKGIRVPGWVYYPHPQTKIRNFQDASLVEVICDHIPGIHYGISLHLEINPGEIHICE